MPIESHDSLERYKQKARGSLVNRTDLARVLGVSLVTIDDWVRVGCPYTRKGRRGHQWLFDTADVYDWRMEWAESKANKTTERLDYNEAKARKESANAQLAELDLAIKRGEYVPVSDISAGLVKMISSIRNRMLALPTALAPRLNRSMPTAEAEQLLRGAIHEGLDALSDIDIGPTEEADTGEVQRVQVPPKANGERVGGPEPATEPGECGGTGAVAY